MQHSLNASEKIEGAPAHNSNAAQPAQDRRGAASVIIGIIGFIGLWGGALVMGTPGGAFSTFVDGPAAICTLASPLAILLVVFGWSGCIDACSYVFREPSPGKSAEDAVTFFRLWAAFALASGFLAAMVGTICMLANLEDPARIGPGMALALLSQLYGVFSAVVSLALGAIVARKHNGTASGRRFGQRAVFTSVLAVTIGSFTSIMAMGIMFLAFSGV